MLAVSSVKNNQVYISNDNYTTHPASFDSLLCRYPSQLGGLVAQQKSQAQTWIQTGDLRDGSV